MAAIGGVPVPAAIVRLGSSRQRVFRKRLMMAVVVLMVLVVVRSVMRGRREGGGGAGIGADVCRRLQERVVAM